MGGWVGDSYRTFKITFAVIRNKHPDAGSSESQSNEGGGVSGRCSVALWALSWVPRRRTGILGGEGTRVKECHFGIPDSTVPIGMAFMKTNSSPRLPPRLL